MASNQGDLPPSPHQVASNFQGARLPPTATYPSHLAKSPQLGSMCGDFSWRLPKSPHLLASADPQFECLWRLLMVTSKVATVTRLTANQGQNGVLTKKSAAEITEIYETLALKSYHRGTTARKGGKYDVDRNTEVAIQLSTMTKQMEALAKNCVRRPNEASARVATKSRHEIEKLRQCVRRQNEASERVATKSRHSDQLSKTVAFHHGDQVRRLSKSPHEVATPDGFKYPTSPIHAILPQIALNHSQPLSKQEITLGLHQR
ncbi:hypothetical protein LWI29_029018 [Acer saccharum]|uniref:Uncharacterized protein n=1 Tax=Acer saccharum TaxID=4024 RepID=A0AA39SP67_ACESA|nr:hypothetical protein LWI29_029018 [Acer saccharum]